jgi:MFS family permease
MPVQKIRRRYPRRVVSAAVLTGVVSYAVMQSVIGHVLPELQRQLHTNQGLVSWVMTGYLLSASVCTPIAGRLGDRYGKHRLLFATLVAMAAGCLISAIAPTISVMRADIQVTATEWCR